MIRYSQENLEWLTKVVIPGFDRESSTKMRAAGTQSKLDPRVTPKDDSVGWKLEEANATIHTWQQPIDLVVCETYLGVPLTSLPQSDKLHTIIDEANSIAAGFLKNLAPQLKKGTRLCVALPAWHLGDGRFEHLPLLDHLDNLGYNRLDLVHASRSELIYHRPEQTVARELTILVRS